MLPLLAVLSACATPHPAACLARPAPPGDAVWVVDHGWHTDLAIPARSLRGPMTAFRQLFPGMTVLLVGFGRRTFMTAPVTNLGDLLIGPFPGDGVLLVAGLTAPPDRAYADGTEAVLPLSPDRADRLSAFLWRSFALDHGRPRRIGPGFFPGSVFFAARHGYSGFYTCNSWTEDALHQAGLAPGPAGVVLAGQVMVRVARRAAPACAIGGDP